ncbi:MAG TPA: hypothetical protein PK370_00520 [Candidatus Woesebacteria bacterium]|nr:hypothetical protein [Candidatus Woesebacteria bacterium]HPJ17160.1 hypothetical protein [Candidatus Woesebacteria bacterium]
MKKYFKNLLEISLSLFLVVLLGNFVIKPVFSAQFSRTIVRFDRMKINTNSTMFVSIVPAGTGTEAKIKIVFGAGVTVPGTPTITVTGLPSGTTELPGTLTAVGSGSSIVISGVNDLSIGTTYGFNISNGVTTPSSAGSILNTVSTLNSGDVVIDSAQVSSRFITDDQIVITANVPPTFTFALSGNTDAFVSDLIGTTVVSTQGRTVSVTTNAAKGWIGWVKSANQALSSVTSLENIGTSGTVDGSPSTCVNGIDCYLLDADLTTSGVGSGSLSISGEYNGLTTASGGTLSNQFQPFATRTGKTDGDVITLIARASIVATKAAAADYTDTLTVIGAGVF